MANTSNDDRTRLPGPPDVAEYLGTTIANLARWRWEDSGPPYRRVGRLIRYRWDEVDQWVEAHAIGTTSGGAR
jgi:hypothetical protein